MEETKQKCLLAPQQFVFFPMATGGTAAKKKQPIRSTKRIFFQSDRKMQKRVLPERDNGKATKLHNIAAIAVTLCLTLRLSLCLTLPRPSDQLFEFQA